MGVFLARAFAGGFAGESLEVSLVSPDTEAGLDIVTGLQWTHGQSR